MINEVYNVVQGLLNKNGYGILTPARFNSFAEAAQLDVLENIIHDIQIEKRRVTQHDANNSLKLYETILDKFSVTELVSRKDSSDVVQDYHLLPSDYMTWGSAFVDGAKITKVEARKQRSIKYNYFIPPTSENPYCYIEGIKMYVLPEVIGVIYDEETPIAYDEVTLNYVRYPLKPNWTFNTISNKSVFNKDSLLFQDFELPPSMMNRLIRYIAGAAGLSLRDESVVAYTNNEDQKDFQKDNR